MKIHISINSGASLVLYVVCFFALVVLSAKFARVENIFPVAIASLTGAFGGYLVKRNANNKINLESERKADVP